ncbi:hypothetical protein ACFE04_025114 [Oxalis oulophora]
MNLLSFDAMVKPMDAANMVVVHCHQTGRRLVVFVDGGPRVCPVWSDGVVTIWWSRGGQHSMPCGGGLVMNETYVRGDDGEGKRGYTMTDNNASSSLASSSSAVGVGHIMSIT